jgi:hypothetical protein
MDSAHEFIHFESLGNLSACRDILHEVDDTLSQLYQKRNILGYQAFIIKDATGIDEALIMFDINEITLGIFPFTYVAVQPLEHSNLDIDNLMQGWSFTKINN